MESSCELSILKCEGNENVKECRKIGCRLFHLNGICGDDVRRGFQMIPKRIDFSKLFQEKLGEQSRSLGVSQRRKERRSSSPQLGSWTLDLGPRTRFIS